MALIRPVVLVFEEIASPTVTPATPDLNVLVVGPAYYIQDYFAPGTTTYADKTSIPVGTNYGVLEGNPATATPSGTAVIVVAQPPNNHVGALLDPLSVQVFFDQARVIIDTASTATTSSATPNTITATGTTWNTVGTHQVLPGDRITVSDGTHFFTRTVMSVTNDTTLLITADIPGAPFAPGPTQLYRIERQLNDQLVASSFYTVNGQSVSINGSVTLTANGVLKTVSYAVPYEAYRSLRQDLTVLDTVEQESDILAKIGRLDARDPLASAVFVALQNTTSVVQYVGVLSNDLPGYTTVRDSIAARGDVYAIVPLTADVPTISMWNSDCLGLALPDESTGRPQRFRVVLGSGTLPLTQTMIPPSLTGQSTQVTSTAPAIITKITLPAFPSLVTANATPGDKLVITLDAGATNRNGTYVVASVESATVLETDPSTPFPAAETGNLTAELFASDGVTVKVGATAVTAAVTALTDDLYLLLTDPSGTFVSSGVAVGDLVEIPADPNAAITSSSVFSKLVVSAVLSENRLQVANNGQDTATVVNELPHGVKRIGGALVTGTAISYQIIRNLSKSQQVTNLVAVAQSFNSSRTVLVWPDKCDVAGVTGGTAQPGYYLSAAVGGMTAGLPAQQGFTNLGIAGISKLYDSNTYFTDLQMTQISNGGWFVFAQATPTSLPFSIHQLTTNVSTLESGEYSVVKNFDFVSLFFVGIMNAFLGVYNVTNDTLVLLRGALNTGGDLLKLRTVAKIGAPLTSFSIIDVGVSPVSGDRVVIHLSIGLPKPLNVIELHLVS